MSTNIHSLLKTEKHAAELESNARQYRSSKLKQAKIDASKDIDQYKKEKDEELTRYKENVTVSDDGDELVELELALIKEIVGKKKDLVIKLLVDAVVDVKPVVHQNA